MPPSSGNIMTSDRCIITCFDHRHGELLGGDVYDAMVAEALSANFSVRTIDATPWLPHVKKPQQILRAWSAQFTTQSHIFIRGPIALAAMTRRSPRTCNIALIHHVDDTTSQHPRFDRLFTKRYLEKARSCDVTVVVAEYWRKYAESHGISPTDVIYNGFDIDLIDAALQGADTFRRSHGLSDKPTVYIGNARSGKGATAVYEVLQNCNLHLVTSGVQSIRLPVQNFALTYSDYIRLLASCDLAITMSTFLEGWNRTAHEAMICRTPVIGSGKGGMHELLEQGGQLICHDLRDLPAMVEHVMNHAEAIGERGYTYARKFTKARFANAWTSLINRLYGNRIR